MPTEVRTMKFPACALAVLLLSTGAFAAAPPGAARPVDFTRDVRPILAGKCFQCHGPDEKARKARLRLDTRQGATKKSRSGAIPIVPGDPGKSELIARVTDPTSSIMPPPRLGKPLSAAEVRTLKTWIAQGAKYATHWAYVKPVRPALPAVRHAAWASNPIDRLVLARLDREGLAPTPAAERAALLRRVALDLTGLPPTVEMAGDFLRDTRPGAYERAVDRLLASPAFGERWAVPWLDLARYADSQGYANDPDRTIWRWRDWVITALNANLPYDQFTTLQLAGDLLPGATTEQRIATGFHRNTLTNTEGGTSPEEFRSAAVVDRVNTTFQVWMGTTIGCAQCHNHKYDPFSQKEYYQLYAIFNNTEDRNAGDDFPTLRVAAFGRDREFAELTAKLDPVRKKLAAEQALMDAGLAAWEKTTDRTKLPKDVATILPVPKAKRQPGQTQRLLAYHRSLSADWRALDAEVRALDARFRLAGTTVPILREGKPRATHVHIRGNFLDKGVAVQPGLPAALRPAPVADAPGSPKTLNRLTLARWLMDEDNPLTARVAVNRFWEELFGTGLVQTSEEFGTQGELPSHPELLDWLAVEFRESGWDVKRLLRLIVTSATYRQDSRVSAALGQRDPFNRLLARGPRLRLSAEAIRDQALFAAGLLSPKMFGPPVQPPRPMFGLAAAFGSSTDWQPSQGEDRRRRALYTRWRRNAPYPSATTFDAPERTVCNVRRVRTNTPLQALVTLNDPVFVEAAQGLARRVLAQPGSTRDRVNYAFRLCLTRDPREAELAKLEGLFEKAKKQLAATPANALDLATKPLGPLPQGMNPADAAAWTIDANVLLTLDETLARR
jgi:mono/diheme cytochrome c family protein